jgi:choline-sulfatase
MPLGDEMPKDPFETTGAQGPGVSRRRFMKGAAALAAAAALPSTPGIAGASADQGAAIPVRLPARPNIVLLITDQERFPQHWPDGWADRNLPNRARLAKHGLTFTRAYCAASMCSPSRASIFTGVYPAEHGVTEVLQYGSDPDQVGQSTLQPSRENMAKLLASAGYDVQYRGKWHVSKDPSGTLPVQSPRDLGRYGFLGWLPPDAGSDGSAAVFGGGDTDYDSLYAAQAATFLQQADPRSPTPFALIVALVNPHDVMGYPQTWNERSYSDIPPYQGSDNYGSAAPACFEQGISLPSTWNEVLRENFKPHAQWQSTEMWSLGLDPIRSPEKMREYVNFYAYLHRESDRHIGTVLDALESNRGLAGRTIVIRIGDHGEMGLAHGGMREKGYNAYEETIHVPLVVSNPRLFPRPVRTDALASLIDLMPTLATLAGVPNRTKRTFRGRDLTPVIRDAIDHPGRPTRQVQESILFTTDETIGTDPDATPLGPVVRQPCHVRCIREAEWKYTMYFDPAHVEAPEYELYDLATDPLELHNMADPAGPYYDAARVAEMQAKLARRMAETHTTPA